MLEALTWHYVILYTTYQYMIAWTIILDCNRLPQQSSFSWLEDALFMRWKLIALKICRNQYQQLSLVHIAWIHISTVREDWEGSGQKWGPQNGLWERESGGMPPENLKFYMLWSVFWGLLSFFFMHAHSTYILASCCLRLVVSDWKIRRMGP